MTENPQKDALEASVSEAKTSVRDLDLDPAVITRRLEAAVLEELLLCGSPETTAIAILRRLERLASPTSGKKLVFLRSEVFQIFGIMERKLRAEERL